MLFDVSEVKRVNSDWLTWHLVNQSDIQHKLGNHPSEEESNDAPEDEVVTGGEEKLNLDGINCQFGEAVAASED